MSDTPKIALLLNQNMADRVFGPAARDVLAPYLSADRWSGLPEKVTKEWMVGAAKDATVVITCWETPKVDADVLAAAPDLRLLAHGAGTPRAVVTDEVFERGVHVTTAAPIIADDVGETTIAVLISALKRFPQMSAGVRAGGWKNEALRESLYRLRGLRVGVLSASFVGRKTMELLRVFGCEILLYDPYVTAEQAAALGVVKATTDEIFATCRAVCVHAPNLAATHHLVSRKLLMSMMEPSVLVNNSRGPVVDEIALIDALKTKNIFACIDVTDPEPPLPENPLRTLPNVLMTPHMAGGQTMNGRQEQGLFIAQQVAGFLGGQPLSFDVTKEMMEIIA